MGLLSSSVWIYALVLISCPAVQLNAFCVYLVERGSVMKLCKLSSLLVLAIRDPKVLYLYLLLVCKSTVLKGQFTQITETHSILLFRIGGLDNFC